MATRDSRFDFRRVYATELQRSLGCPAAKVLPAMFEPPALIA